MSEMKWHEDINQAFKPLLDHVRQTEQDEEVINKAVGQYMYMGHNDDCYNYKHIDTRGYIFLAPDGTLKHGKMEDWKDWE